MIFSLLSIVLYGWNRFNQSRDFLDWFHTEVDRYAPLVSVAQSEVFGQAWARDSSVVACSGQCAVASQSGPSYLWIQRGVLRFNRRKKDV